MWSKDKVLIKFMGADEVKNLSVIDRSLRVPAYGGTNSLLRRILSQSLNLPGL